MKLSSNARRLKAHLEGSLASEFVRLLDGCDFKGSSINVVSSAIVEVTACSRRVLLLWCSVM